MKKSAGSRVSGILLLMLSLAATTSAQETSPPADAQPGPEAVDKNANKKLRFEQTHPKVSFAERLYSNLRNAATFSFGLSETYASNLLDNVGNNTVAGRPDTITSFYSRFFGNKQGRRTGVSVDYVSGYRVYKQSSELNTPEHRGSIAFQYRHSPRLSIEVSERTSSSPNDIGSPLGQPLASPQLDAGLSQQVFFERERIFTNLVRTEAGYRFSPFSQVRMSASHMIQRFRARPLSNTDGLMAEFQFQRRLNRTVDFTSGYGFQHIKFNNRLNEADIHRLEMAGFDYRLRPTLRLYGSGGLEITRFEGAQGARTTVRAGIAKETPFTNIAFDYERGFNGALGVGTVTRSDSYAFRLNRRITRWLNILTWSAYSRNETMSQGAPFKIFQAQPRLEFALQRNLILFLNYNYVNQQGRNALLRLPSLTRYYVSCGLEYIFASVNRR